MLRRLILTILLLLPLCSQSQPPVVTIDEGAVSDSETRLPLKELRTFTQVFEQIRLGYVEEVTDTELLENAIAGLLTGLDPHSTYLKADDYGDLQENATGEYGGLGMEVAGDGGLIREITPIQDTPADKAHIEAGH